jgi:MFS family permease
MTECFTVNVFDKQTSQHFSQCNLKYFSGPVSSILANRFSHRTVVIVGSISGAVGMAMSAFANSVYFLYISFGIIGGRYIYC